MIQRYQNPAIAAIWDFSNQITVWTKIEQLVLNAWRKRRLIPDVDWVKLKKLSVPSVQNVQHFEAETKHQVIGFLQALSTNLGTASKWIHYGLTSNDILDSAQNYLSVASLDLVLKNLNRLLHILTKRALADKHVLMVGRTHGRFAEPITVGLFFVRWVAELQRHKERLTKVRDEIAIIKISGATGTYTHLPFDIENEVARALKMRPATVSTQIIARDSLIAMYQAGVNLATTLESLAIDLRNGQRSEINEFQEDFTEQQQGSSAMPHKMNPIQLEKICGLARLLRGLGTSIYQTNLLWNERDLTNSALERVIVPDFFHLLMTMLSNFVTIIDRLKINYDQIKANLKAAQVAIYSQNLLLTLLAKTNLDRQTAYKLVQDVAFQVRSNKTSFQIVLQTHPITKHLTANVILKCCNLNSLMPKVNQIYQRIFAANHVKNV